MKPHRVAGIAALALLASVPVAADPIRAGDIVVEQAWARATAPAAKTGAAYLTIRNAGTQPDRIASMAAPVAGHVMAHQTKQEGDVLRMHEAGPLALPPGGALDMKPGGTHVMLMDLKGGLKPGQEFPLTVTFEKAGAVQVPVKVGKPGAMGPE
ncbi:MULTISPECIES: copper chaperone PCu(A)C [Azospirillum]|uniref:Copper chaperone PCu(A)C n=1 Tax=Azospirillum brasilense TaxID=192 RepID=A0A6L3B2B2_AZOBR|nr:copper chaperone PCu(A)C [Azospirillum brasilense]KAA0686107.1 copper chaperone PCu(A)C [Azospirillum brasilense]